MTDLSIVGWSVLIVALVVSAGWLYWLRGLTTKDRLMRCPETGSVTFVGVERVSRGDGKAPELTVRRCDLWPKQKDCARGCLARYSETSPGYRVNLDALRPFNGGNG
jgi:hypothetical protein